MNKIQSGVTLAVYADPEYSYEVYAGNGFGQYLDYVAHPRGERIHLSFGSIAEMQAVANAMLKAIEIAKRLEQET